MQSPPRTFPYQLNYSWLENKGESFESNKVELKKFYFSVINGKGIIFNKSVYQETTYNKREYKKDFLKMLKSASRTEIFFKSNVYFVLDIWSKGPYHFYVDVLSKLIELKTTLKVDFEKSTIVLFRDNFTEKVIIPLLNQI